MYPPVTMEDAAIAAEERYYGNLSSTVKGKPGGFDSDTGNHKVAELNYSNAARRIGPNALLRVMSGDKVSVSVDAFYSSTDQDNSNSSVVADVVASLVSAFGGGSSTAMDPTGHYTIGDRNITSFNTTSYPDITNALKSDDPNTDNGKPKAYVNWILFDEQFNMVRSSSATRQVDMAADTRQQMAYTDIAMNSNGYLYVYLSNESPMSVFFDNFQVTHRHGPILEETHYYPFGLTMAGILSKALNNIAQNKRGYNGNEIQNKEFSDGSGLDWYDFNARTYDQQIGRFHQIDPLVEDGQESLSPYHFSFNNPIRYSDADGKAPEDIIIRGENNSSVTLQTDLIDIDVNVSSLGIDFGGSYTLNGEDVLSAGLDIVGVVDPTGVADGINAGLQAKNGDWLGAGISALGIIPYVGDIAKVGKIGKDIKIIDKAIDVVKAEKRAAKLSQVERAGKDFTKAGKEAVIDVNKAKHGGVVKCESCGAKTVPATKSQKGVTPSKKERQVDHIKPKSKGGSGTPDNGQVLCRDCNIKKSDN